jgi:hypothetical protein
MSAWTKGTAIHRGPAKDFPTQLDAVMHMVGFGSDSHRDGKWRELRCC